MKPTEKDIEYMHRAVTLAKRGKGRTSPNPAVGCIVVKNDQVIGEGYHKKAGGPHAEINAIKSCKVRPKGATVYVTLEPCNHHGKTGPCSQALIEAGVSEVVVGCKDSSIASNGSSIEELRRAGIKVRYGVLQNECACLVEDFLKHKFTGIPFVILKAAWTLDGKIATVTGDSKWISSPESRQLAHKIRNQVDAVVVGSNTVLADDPELTVRYGKNRNSPMRIVIDSGLVTPIKSKIVQMAGKIPTLIFTAKDANQNRLRKIEGFGVQVVQSPKKKKQLDLKRLLVELGKLDVMSVLVESGGALASALIANGLVDRGIFFIAPKFVGGKYCALGDLAIKKMENCIRLNSSRTYCCGPDIIIETDFRNNQGI
ncbi:MAG TPA: bifunctional diaminohydroxyphosphoribosylaminopyrimidine deaminase/5-amino-6-(5-phosphoribosylamino)uracil reductase RibD [Nitrospinota bacterium]|nr:bifunctional diaminohydroxyphosphoribosylaminopyrimidine deaminase/5-amino-6-(5-phosphoribosylamino)uracil reductase RibD [Nitrospinota bacterium]|tara:strand:- start:107635 stop:108747 length:1113 start_codon:yes stop_codon:yes gene_type:complete